MEMIDERKVSHGKNERRDLLSNLVHANEEFLDDGEQRLTEEELLGTTSTCSPVVHLSNGLLSREHVHVLPCWTRGEQALLYTDHVSIAVARQTSGHTLGFALNMLAVHPEEQEVLHKHIQDVLPNGRLPVSVKLLSIEVPSIIPFTDL